MSGKRLSQRALRELGIAEDQIAAARSEPLTPDEVADTDWNRLLDYLEVNAPADVDDVIAVLEVRARRSEKRAALATTDSADSDTAPERAGERAALGELRALRITGDEIDAAIDSLGPTGDRAEAYVKVAAAATAAALRLLSDPRLAASTPETPEHQEGAGES